MKQIINFKIINQITQEKTKWEIWKESRDKTKEKRISQKPLTIECKV